MRVPANHGKECGCDWLHASGPATVDGSTSAVRAARPAPGTGRPGPPTPRRDPAGETVPVPVRLFPRHGLSARRSGRSGDRRRRTGRRPAGNGPPARRPSGDAGRREQAAECFDQDRPPLAQVRPGRQALPLPGQASARLQTVGGGRLSDDASRPRGARRPVLPDDGRRARRSAAAGQAAVARRRRHAHRSQPAHGAATGPLRGGRSVHHQEFRPRAPRPGPVSEPDRPAQRGSKTDHL